MDDITLTGIEQPLIDRLNKYLNIAPHIEASLCN